MVLLSNGKTVPKSSFKGVIPEKFLTTQTKSKTPENNTTDEDIERNKAIISNPTSRVSRTMRILSSDPTKTFSKAPSTTRKPSRSVFQPKEKPDVTLGTVIRDVSESISNVFIPDSTTQPKQQSKPIDIFKGLNDFLSSFNKPSIIPSCKC